MKIKVELLVFICICCLLVGIAIGWSLLNSGTKETDIKLVMGENELTINLKQDLSSISTILEKVFSEEFSESSAKEWLKRKKKLFQVNDPQIVNEIKSLKYEDLVSKELRELQYKRDGPWSYQLDSIRIGVPKKIDQPNQGYANVCENGKYWAKKIKIFNADQSAYVIVQGTGKYECPDGLNFADIQLNSKDAKDLLGTSNFSKYENGMALILSNQ